MIRILQIVGTLNHAGTEKQMLLLARGLPRAEFEVHVCALDADGPLRSELAAAGIPVTVIGRRWPIDPQAWWRLRRTIASIRPNLVHAWTQPANAYGWSAARACGLRQVIVSRRTVGRASSGAAEALDRFVARRASALVVNSAAIQSDVGQVAHLPALRAGERQVGNLPHMVHLIPNGVAPPAAPPVTRAQLLAELNLSQSARLVGIVGRLLLQKRLKDAIWAADLLKVIRDDVHLLIVGDGPHLARLLRFRDQVEIPDKVHFLGERGDVDRLLSHLDVFWHTSGREGASNAILEAMAAGVPVVATDIPATRELVLDKTTGYLVQVGHRAGFTRWTNYLLDNPDAAREMGAAGRERALGQLSAQAMVDRYAALYRAQASSTLTRRASEGP